MSSAPSPQSHAHASPGQLEAIAQRLVAALGNVRIASISFHEEDADVVWLTESVLGPDEHEAVRASIEIFTGEGAPVRHEYDLGDGRVAVTWRVSLGAGSVLGVIMVIVDQRTVGDAKLAAYAECMQEAVKDFATWLADDLSATQLRLRALPDFSSCQPPEEDEAEVEFELVDYVPPAPPASAAQPPANAQANAQAPATAGAPAHALANALTSPPGTGGATAIDPALDRHFSALRAQPIVLYAQQLEPVSEGSRIRRFEILLRTGSDHGRTQAPVAMLEAATKKGLGTVVDRRVITDLLVWLSRNSATWRTNPINVTVNLSATTLVDPNFLKFLELCLTKSALPRGMVGFELDAALCARQVQRTTDFAEVLSALGCKMVLDDFSLESGQLDLLRLKGLRMLKFHPQLTTSIAADKRAQSMVAGIAQMARVQGMHTCAKAVESKQQLPLLAALKVDFAQGFAFSVPRPLAQLGEEAAAA